jgi:uncharacterized protein HemX
VTDLRTRPVEEQRRDEAATGIRTATGGRIIVLALVVGVLVGGVVFASSGSSRAELEQARWQQVVDYYEQQYQMMADTRARNEAAYWQDVINHYARQYALIAEASSTPATDRQSAHWEAVVDYYEQQWELRGQ